MGLAETVPTRLYHAMGETYVNPTRLIESEDLAIVEFAAKAVGNETDAKAKVSKPFYAVRDDVRNDAYLPLGDVTIYSGKGSLAMGEAGVFPRRPCWSWPPALKASRRGRGTRMFAIT